MKKNCIFWMFAVLIIAIGMTACGNNDDENSSGETRGGSGDGSLIHSLKR